MVVKNDGKLSKDMSQITSECLSIRFSYEYVWDFITMKPIKDIDQIW